MQTEVTHNNVTVNITKETRKGKNGNADSCYYTPSLSEIQSPQDLVTFFGSLKTLIEFVQPELNRGMISTQLVTPSMQKPPVSLTDEQKADKCCEYMATIEESTRRRTGPKSELKALLKAQGDLMRNFNPVTDTAKLIEFATKIAKLQAEIDAKEND